MINLGRSARGEKKKTPTNRSDVETRVEWKGGRDSGKIKENYVPTDGQYALLAKGHGNNAFIPACSEDETDMISSALHVHQLHSE